MAVFQYTARDERRGQVRGTISADSPRDARDQLRSRGLAIQQLHENRASRKSRWFDDILPSRTQDQWTHTVYDLSLLIGAGIPLTDALDTVIESQQGRFKTALLQVQESVIAGSSFSDSLALQPRIFDALSIHLVQVGENSGRLHEVLEQLAQFRQRMLQLKDKVLTTLLYPAFLLIFGTGAMVFLMTYVLPPLLDNLQESDIEIPWPTKVVRAFSSLFTDYGWLLATGLVIAIGTLVTAVRTERGKRLWHRWKLKIPGLGDVSLKQSISRISLVVSTLCQTGVDLVTSLKLAARTSDNLVIHDALMNCSEQLAAGKDISIALQAAGVFPPLVVRIFAVGQESGRLPDMLEKLTTEYDRQVETRCARIAAMIEPISILVLATMIGFVMIATILPILEAGNVL